MCVAWNFPSQDREVGLPFCEQRSHLLPYSFYSRTFPRQSAGIPGKARRQTLRAWEISISAQGKPGARETASPGGGLTGRKHLSYAEWICVGVISRRVNPKIHGHSLAFWFPVGMFPFLFSVPGIELRTPTYAKHMFYLPLSYNTTPISTLTLMVPLQQIWYCRGVSIISTETQG